MSYTKLFSSIVTSTIWTEDANTCKVWVTMLAIANKHGEIQASIPGLAQISGIPVDSVEGAVQKFLSPDRYSRTPDDEGRRIETIDGGWALLNHGKYREMASKDEQKEANAERQKRFRERQKRNATVTHSNGTSQPVTETRDIAEAEADTEADTPSNKKKKSASAPSASLPPSLPFGDPFADAWGRWEKHRKEIRKPLQPTQTTAQLAKLAKMTEAEAVAMIDHTIEMGWQGLREPERTATGKSAAPKSTIEDLMGGRKLSITKIDPNEQHEPEPTNDDPCPF